MLARQTILYSKELLNKYIKNKLTNNLFINPRDLIIIYYKVLNNFYIALISITK